MAIKMNNQLIEITQRRTSDYADIHLISASNSYVSMLLTARLFHHHLGNLVHLYQDIISSMVVKYRVLSRDWHCNN